MQDIILSAQTVRDQAELPDNVKAECKRIMSRIIHNNKNGKQHIQWPLYDTPKEMLDDITTIFLANNYTIRDAADPTNGKILCW